MTYKVTDLFFYDKLADYVSGLMAAPLFPASPFLPKAPCPFQAFVRPCPFSSFLPKKPPPPPPRSSLLPPSHSVYLLPSFRHVPWSGTGLERGSDGASSSSSISSWLSRWGPWSCSHSMFRAPITDHYLRLYNHNDTRSQQTPIFGIVV